jgi:hypothetical protein
VGNKVEVARHTRGLVRFTLQPFHLCGNIRDTFWNGRHAVETASLNKPTAVKYLHLMKYRGPLENFTSSFDRFSLRE